MKKYVFLIPFVLSVLISPHAQAKFPIHLGGFIISDDINQYPGIIDPDTCQPDIINAYIGECRVVPPPGFKSGSVSFGRCERTNKIVRIKLKYEESSKQFYSTLLKKYKAQLGDPTEYRGDPFQTLIAWKWSFTDAHGETLSLILQHNSTIADEKMGNAVKLTWTSQLKAERDCYIKKNPPVPPKRTETPDKKDLWRSFIPY